MKPTKILYANAITHFARAIGLARSGNGDAASAEIARLAELREALAAAGNTYWADQVEIQRLGAAAWAALAEGRRDEALELMREAADKESATEKASISPGPILPARELLGDMLLEVGQPAAALKEYEASHEREPNRFRGWYGAASAAAKAGNAAKAKTYLREARGARAARGRAAGAPPGKTIPCRAAAVDGRRRSRPFTSGLVTSGLRRDTLPFPARLARAMAA